MLGLRRRNRNRHTKLPSIVLPTHLKDENFWLLFDCDVLLPIFIILKDLRGSLHRWLRSCALIRATVDFLSPSGRVNKHPQY